MELRPPLLSQPGRGDYPSNIIQGNPSAPSWLRQLLGDRIQSRNGKTGQSGSRWSPCGWRGIWNSGLNGSTGVFLIFSLILRHELFHWGYGCFAERFREVKCLLQSMELVFQLDPRVGALCAFLQPQNLLCFSVPCLVVSDVVGMGLGKTQALRREGSEWWKPLSKARPAAPGVAGWKFPIACLAQKIFHGSIFFLRANFALWKMPSKKTPNKTRNTRLWRQKKKILIFSLGVSREETMQSRGPCLSAVPTPSPP